MAKLTFTLDELLNILKLNNRLPEQIVRAEVKKDSIDFTINTNIFLLPVIPVSLKYISFENNTAKFELNVAGGQFNKALGMFGNSYQSKIPEYVKLELPYVLVDLERLISHKNIKGIRVKEITQTDGQLTIVTE